MCCSLIIFWGWLWWLGVMVSVNLYWLLIWWNCCNNIGKLSGVIWGCFLVKMAIKLNDCCWLVFGWNGDWWLNFRKFKVWKLNFWCYGWWWLCIVFCCEEWWIYVRFSDWCKVVFWWLVIVFCRLKFWVFIMMDWGLVSNVWLGKLVCFWCSVNGVYINKWCNIVWN